MHLDTTIQQYFNFGHGSKVLKSGKNPPFFVGA